jgi:hypothetical protein
MRFAMLLITIRWPHDARRGNASSLHRYVIYPVVAGFGALFLAIGLRNFRRRVLS